MSLYFALKMIHILSGAVLFGTGAGIAFFMLRAHATRDARTVAEVGRIVVLADFVFTASAVVVQPISGLGLIHLQGWSLTSPWLLAAYGLYVLVGLCWLPVVWIQYRMMKLAEPLVVRPGLARLRRRPGHLLADGRQADVLRPTRSPGRNGAGSPGRR